MHTLLLATSSTERFTVLLGFLTALLVFVAAVGHVLWKALSAARDQLEATKQNTSAIKDLSARMASVEEEVTAGRPYKVRVEHGKRFHVYNTGQIIQV